ncbi:hypothetical protein D9M71_603580 [compost metagenome]
MLVHPLLKAYAHEAAGEQVEIGIGKFAAQDDLAGARIDRDVSEQQLARQWVHTAVVLYQRGLDLVLADRL